MTELNILQIEAIAKLATEIIKKEFDEVGFKNPPKITNGIVQAVLDAMQQSRSPTPPSGPAPTMY